MRRALLAVLLAGLAAPAGAAAATRYATPSGGETSCSRTAPCGLAWALSGGGSAAGDTVVVAPGTYPDAPLTVARPLTVTAALDRARPLLPTTADGTVTLTVAPAAAGTVLEHLAIRATGDEATGIRLDGEAALSDLTVRTGRGACLRSDAQGVRIDDSAFTQDGVTAGPCLETTGADTSWSGVLVTALNAELAAAYSGNGEVVDGTFTGQVIGLQLGGSAAAHRITAAGAQRGVVLSGTTTVTDSVAIARAGGSAFSAGSGTHQLLNVTAWATGTGSAGIRSTTGADVDVKNTIARGDAADLIADPASTTITDSCGVFTGCPAGRLTVDHSNFRTAFGVEDLGSNQSASPRFADAAFDDFRLRKGSPAIDAGSFEFNSGSADRAGRFRWLGARPDMGAYEFPSPRKMRPKADRKAPTLGVVRLTATTFRAGRHGTAFSAAGAPVGTTLVFVVSEDSDLVAQVFRPGGKRSVGTIVEPAARGTHHLAMSGRLDGRPLRPGRYVLVVMARDVAQNLSAPRRLAFRVVR